MRFQRKVTLTDFSGGHGVASDSRDGISSVGLDNVMPMGNRGLRTRTANAFVTAGTSTSGAPTALYYYRGSNQYLMVTGTDIVRLPSTTIKTGWLGGVRTSFAEFQNAAGTSYVYINTHSGTPVKFDGTTLSNWTATTGTVPTGKSMAVWGNRIWVAGNTSNPSRLFFSGIMDADSWGGYVDVDPSSGVPITAIVVCGSYLLVFKEDKIYVVYDFNTGAYRTLTNAYGVYSAAGSQWCVAPSRDGVFFCDPRGGIYYTDGASVRKVSDAVPDENFTPGGSTLYMVCSGRFLYVFDAGNAFWLYDSLLGSWWPHSTVYTGANGRMMPYRTSDGPRDGLMWFHGSGTTGIYGWLPDHTVKQPSSLSTTDGTGGSITGKWFSMPLDPDAMATRRRLRQVDFEAYSTGAVTLGAYHEATSFERSVSLGGSITSPASTRLKNPGVGRYWRLGITGGAGVGWRLWSVTAAFTELKN